MSLVCDSSGIWLLKRGFSLNLCRSASSKSRRCGPLRAQIRSCKVPQSLAYLTTSPAEINIQVTTRQYVCWSPCANWFGDLHFMAPFRTAAAFLGWQTLIHLGGAGLILLGIVDQSFVPIPGGMDAITIVLAAGHRNLWLYYAAMATVGTVLGAFLTYRLSKKGGKAALEKKLSRRP